MSLIVEKELELKVNKHFMDYVSTWRYETCLLVGAYGSSKSYETATKLVLKLLGEKRKALVVRNVYETIKESCYDLIYEILDTMDLVTEDKGKEARRTKVVASKSPLQFSFPNGSRIVFKGMDKPEKIKSMNGVTIVWIEEASEISYKAYKEIRLRLRNPNLKIYYLLTTNPVARNNWVYKHFFKRKETKGNKEVEITVQDEAEFYSKRSLYNEKNKTYYHHSIPEDNAFLTLDYIETLEELKTYDPDLYRIARIGRFGVNGKRVLPQFKVADDPKLFKEKVLACKINRNGMDFGFEKSYNAIVLLAIDLKNATLYIYDEYYRNQMTDKQTAEALPEWRDDIRSLKVKCDSAEPKTIKYYRDEGFNFVATHKTTRLEQLKKIKRFKHIICSPKCKNAIAELSELVYAEDKEGEIIPDEFTTDPHTLSAIWYALDDISVADVKERKNNSRG